MSRPGLTQERLVALFLLGVLLFTPPFLGIFNTPDRILGLPSSTFICLRLGRCSSCWSRWRSKARMPTTDRPGRGASPGGPESDE